MTDLEVGATARQLARPGVCVPAEATCDDVIQMFTCDQELNSIVVLDDTMTVIGVLRSLDILRRRTASYFHEVMGRRSCTQIMDRHPLVFDSSVSLKEMSQIVSNLKERQLVDGFIVTENCRYLGVGRMTELIKAVSEMQIVTARYANPLTLLPGNIPIENHMQVWLDQGKAFVVGYFDLNQFKGFNDVYGYREGDAMIRMTASVIGACIDPSLDFLGHVGGDDFVVVFSSPDWSERVQRALTSFDEKVLSLFKREHRDSGGYVTKNRSGVEQFIPLVSLSAGLVRVAPNSQEPLARVSARLAEAKKMAKQQSGSGFFVDRRMS